MRESQTENASALTVLTRISDVSISFYFVFIPATEFLFFTSFRILSLFGMSSLFFTFHFFFSSHGFQSTSIQFEPWKFMCKRMFVYRIARKYAVWAWKLCSLQIENRNTPTQTYGRAELPWKYLICVVHIHANVWKESEQREKKNSLEVICI